MGPPDNPVGGWTLCDGGGGPLPWCWEGKGTTDVCGGGADDAGGGCGPVDATVPPPGAPDPGGTEVAADAIWRLYLFYL